MSLLLLSHPIVSDSLQPCGLQHTRFPVHHLLKLAQAHVHLVSDAIQPFHPLLSPFFLPSISPSIKVVLMSWPFASDGQNIKVSASASVLLMNIQDWFPLGLTGLVSLQSKGLPQVFSNTTVQKHQFFSAQFSLYSNSHSYMTTGKTIAFTRWTFVGKVVSLLFAV